MKNKTKPKETKPEVKTEKKIAGYTWKSGKKEPFYEADPVKPDCLGYTWENGKKEPIVLPKPKVDGEDKGYTWASGKKEPIK